MDHMNHHIDTFRPIRSRINVIMGDMTEQQVKDIVDRSIKDIYDNNWMITLVSRLSSYYSY